MVQRKVNEIAEVWCKIAGKKDWRASPTGRRSDVLVQKVLNRGKL
jgi:hypothetical protein